MRPRPSFYTESSGPEREALDRAFIWLKRRSEETNRSGLLVVPSEGFVDAVLAPALGRMLVDLLDSDEGLPLGDGFGLRLATPECLNEVELNGPLAVCCPDDDLLVRVDALEGLTTALLVPRDRAQAMTWARKWRATVPPDEVYPHFNPPGR